MKLIFICTIAASMAGCARHQSFSERFPPPVKPDAQAVAAKAIKDCKYIHEIGLDKPEDKTWCQSFMMKQAYADYEEDLRRWERLAMMELQHLRDLQVARASRPMVNTPFVVQPPVPYSSGSISCRSRETGFGTIRTTCD